MLQRKLLVLLGSLVALLLVSAVSAIGLLHTVLEDLIQASEAAATGTAATHALEHAAGALVAQLEVARRQPTEQAPGVAEALADVEGQVARLDALELLPPDGPGHRFAALLPELRARVEALRAAPGPAAVEAAAAAAAPVVAEAAAVSDRVRARARRELDALVRKFRIGGLAVGIASLVLLNVSILVVLRAAMMVLRPVNQLVEGSRRLAREQFDHRVRVEQQDEFGELARAYNDLAVQLQANEQRKLETLQQVGRMLSHELKNAISTIELQLTLMDRRAADERLAEPLRRIHQSLARMSGTLDALGRVRRIVLTDYLSGIKMLDLQRSLEDDAGQEAPPARITEIMPR